MKTRPHVPKAGRLIPPILILVFLMLSVDGPNESLTVKAQSQVDVKISKVVDWNGMPPFPIDPFEICLENGPEPQCALLNGGESHTFTNVDTGTYSLTESPGPLWQVTGLISSLDLTTLPPPPASGYKITNKYIGGSLSVSKLVNLPPDSSLPSNYTFEVCISGPDGSPDTSCESLSDGGSHTWTGLVPGEYQVSENTDSMWEIDISQSTVVVPSAGTAVVTIQNTLKNDTFSLAFSKSASATTVDAGDTVTYSFDVTNNGNFYFESVNVIDNECDPSFVGGDNGNGLLDVDETWQYNCSVEIQQDTLNQAFAAGTTPFDGTITSNGAEVFVDVLPKVKLNKSVDDSSKAEPGGTFLFDLDIKNKSSESVEIVSLSDDYPIGAACDALIGQVVAAGDTVSCSYSVALTLPAEYLNTATVLVTDNLSDVVSNRNSDSDSDNVVVNVTDLPSQVSVAKEATPFTVPETGELVTFDITIQNESLADSVTILELNDSVYGDVTNNSGAIDSTNCVTGQILQPLNQPQSSYSCSFTAFVAGNTGDEHVNKISVNYEDDDGFSPSDLPADSATVVIIDANSALEVSKVPQSPEVPEPGGPIRFDIAVTNTSPVDVVTIQSLEDTEFGDITLTSITDPNSAILETTCVAPQVLGVGSSYNCYFVVPIIGNAGDTHSNVVIVSGIDDDLKDTAAAATATVNIADVPAEISLISTPDKQIVPESGDEVEFAVNVTNSSTVDSVIINDVSDDDEGSSDISCEPNLPANLAPAESLSCTFARSLAGDAGRSYINVVAVSGFDDDGKAVSEEVSAQVAFSNVDSILDVRKTASQSTASRAGDPVTFSIRVANLSATDVVTITQIQDSIYGNVADAANAKLLSTDCSVPQVLDAGKLYNCAFDAIVTGQLGTEHRNNVTVIGIDDDQVSVSDFDDAIVLIADPVLEAIKSADLVADDDGIASPNDRIRYQISIKNSGNAVAEGLIFNDIPDANSTLVNGTVTTSQGEIVNGNEEDQNVVTVHLGDLDPGAFATIGFDVIVNNPLPESVAKISNQGLLTGDNFTTLATDSPDNGGPTDTFVQAVPRLEATKTDALAVDANGDGNVTPGDQLFYEIVLRNKGTLAATNVKVTDVIDLNATLLNGSVSTTLGQISEGSGNGDSTVEVDIPKLDIGQEVKIRFTVQIKSPLVASVKQISNQASITADQGAILTDDPDVDGAQDPTVSVLNDQALIEASKTDLLLLDVGDIGFSAGDTIIYRVTIRNSGNVEAKEVIFEDILDQNISLLVSSVQTDQGTVLRGNQPGDTYVEVVVGTIPPKSDMSISFQAVINDSIAPSLLAISNQGVVYSANVADTPTDDPEVDGKTDATVTVLQPRAVLKLTMTDIFFIDADGDNLVSIGDQLLYLINLHNVGKNRARDILVEATPDPNTSLVLGTVTSDSGNIQAGNADADLSILIGIATLQEDESINMRFIVRVDKIPTQGILSAHASAQYVDEGNPVSGQTSNAVSDDPSTSEANDPTVTRVGIPLTETLFAPILTY